MSLLARSAFAQDLTVYDDALYNGFSGDTSYGAVTDFNSTAQVHRGTKSVSFTGNNYKAVSFSRTGQSVSTADYPTLHFWIHGGTTGGQPIYIVKKLNDATAAQASLDTYISGGAIAANTWREVPVTFANSPLAYSGLFLKICVVVKRGRSYPATIRNPGSCGQVFITAASSCSCRAFTHGA